MTTPKLVRSFFLALRDLSGKKDRDPASWGLTVRYVAQQRGVDWRALFALDDQKRKACSQARATLAEERRLASSAGTKEGEQE